MLDHHSRPMFAGVIYWFCETAVCSVPVFYAEECTFTHFKPLEQTVCVSKVKNLKEKKSNVKLRCSGVCRKHPGGCADNFTKLSCKVRCVVGDRLGSEEQSL